MIPPTVFHPIGIIAELSPNTVSTYGLGDRSYSWSFTLSPSPDDNHSCTGFGGGHQSGEGVFGPAAEAHMIRVDQ